MIVYLSYRFASRLIVYLGDTGTVGISAAVGVHPAVRRRQHHLERHRRSGRAAAASPLERQREAVVRLPSRRVPDVRLRRCVARRADVRLEAAAKIADPQRMRAGKRCGAESVHPRGRQPAEPIDDLSAHRRRREEIHRQARRNRGRRRDAASQSVDRPAAEPERRRSGGRHRSHASGDRRQQRWGRVRNWICRSPRIQSEIGQAGRWRLPTVASVLPGSGHLEPLSRSPSSKRGNHPL